MRVPVGDSMSARVIRAHEMTHAKVSPDNLDEIEKVLGITGSTIRAVEEVRVNLLAMSAGFDLDALVDGSERTMGRRVAESKSVRALVEMAIGTMFTKGHADFVKGVRDIDPDTADRLASFVSKVEESIVVDARSNGLRGRIGKKGRGARLGVALRSAIASTKPIRLDEDLDEYRADANVEQKTVVVPRGFTFTANLAKTIDALLDGGSNSPGDVLPDVPGDEVVETSTTTTWAPLVWDRSVALNRWAPNEMGRRRSRTDVGIVPRRIDLLLTDPDRRIFSRDVRSTGGIVLIDQSGSMRLSMRDIEEIVKVSAGCLVIGYSTRPRRPGVPNVWVLADRGRIASRLREGNGGNGCDRPALDYALSVRRGSEPIVWVCDGYVTYSTDDFASAADRLSIIADVGRHGVHMVDDVEDAIDALRRSKTGRLPAKYARNLTHGLTDARVAEVWGGRR
jgi:hypothetical protein